VMKVLVGARFSLTGPWLRPGSRRQPVRVALNTQEPSPVTGRSG
jgi:hypothetical protein